jgi:DNA repair protein RadD
LFAPVIRAGKAGEGGGGMECVCPSCGYENQFSAKVEYLEYKKDAAGYILDLAGAQVMSEHGPIPGHHGRRCMGLLQSGPRGEWERCGYRWTFKECPHCFADNDIAARYCVSCKGEIIDPNEKLVIEFRAMKKDPTRVQTDRVLSMQCLPGISQKGNRTMRVEWVTEYRQFTTWFQPEARHSRGQAQWLAFDNSTAGGTEKPDTITYRKNAETGFYDVLGYNRPADELPEGMKHAAE